MGARPTDSSKGNLLTETDETDGLFKASMAVIGLTGQIWGAFIISEFMTGRVKSSRTGLEAQCNSKEVHTITSSVVIDGTGNS